MSKDGKRLVYLNESKTSDLWTIDLQTKYFQQLTFEDATIYGATYSWDGNKLIYYQMNITEASRNRGVESSPEDSYIICNKDGSERMKFIPTVEGYSWTWFGSRWLPDMESIIIGGGHKDSLEVQSAFFVGLEECADAGFNRRLGYACQRRGKKTSGEDAEILSFPRLDAK